MEFDGSNAILSEDEQRASGLGSPVPVDEIDIARLLLRLADERNELKVQQAADDDDLLHWERASILPEALRIQQHEQILGRMAGELAAHKAQVYLEQNGNGA